MRQRHGTPWFPLDALKMGLFQGAPAFGVHPEDEDMASADRMWPIVLGLIDNLYWDGRDYLVEGVNLRPDTVVAYMAERRDVRACFLGYPGMSAAEKLVHVARADAPGRDWLTQMGEAYALAYLTTCQAASARLRDDCARLGLPFFDTGADHPGALEAAERTLVGG